LHDDASFGVDGDLDPEKSPQDRTLTSAATIFVVMALSTVR